MTVAELIKKLEKCNPDNDIVFYNNDSYWNGTYVATDIMEDSDGTVEILSDYDVRLEDEEDE